MKKLSLWYQYLVTSVVGSIVSVPLVAYAAEEIPKDTTIITLETLKIWINNIKNFLTTVGIAIAVILIIWAGVMYMFAGGETEKVGAAKTRFWNGVIGALIIIGVYLIISTLQALIMKGV